MYEPTERYAPESAFEAAAKGDYKKYFWLWVELVPHAHTSYVRIKATRRRWSRGFETKDKTWSDRMAIHGRRFGEFLHRFCTARFVFAMLSRLCQLNPDIVRTALELSRQDTQEIEGCAHDFVTP